LREFALQDYPADRFEIMVIDGMSADNSREIALRFARGCTAPEIRVMQNPTRQIAAGLNIGIDSARGDVIVIFGAHSYPNRDYVRLVVETLQRTGASAAGGLRREQGDTFLGNAISIARGTFIGGALTRYRLSKVPGDAETIPYAGYRREVFTRVGLFNVDAPPNEDDEFNYRLVAAGLRLYFNPLIVANCQTRSSLPKLARQFLLYGYFKPRVLRAHPGAMRLHLAVPPLFVLSLGICLSHAMFSDAMAFALSFLLGSYLAVVGVFSARAGMTHGWKYAPAVFLSYWVIHLSVGLGMLLGLIGALQPLRPPPRFSAVEP
jgi:glycosyltransferase involved in cell wall biosynthesis